MTMDLPPPKIWMPPKPAIIRPAPEVHKGIGLFFPPPVAMGGGDTTLNTVSMVESTSGTTGANLAYHDGIAAGDILIRCRMSIASTPDTNVTVGNPSRPTWTDIHRATGGTAISTWGAGAYLSLLAGTESGNTPLNYSFSSAGSLSQTHQNTLMVRFRGNIPVTGVNIQSANGQRTTGNPSEQTITASGSSGPVTLALAFYHSTGAVDPRTWSGSYTDEVGGGASNDRVWCKWKVYNRGDTPANHTIDMDDEGTNYLASCYLELS